MQREILFKVNEAANKFAWAEGEKRFTFTFSVIYAKEVDGLVKVEVKSPNGTGWLYSDTQFFIVDTGSHNIGVSMVSLRKVVEGYAKMKPKKIVDKPEEYGIQKVEGFTYFFLRTQDIKDLNELGL